MIALIAINAKYIHTSLAAYSLHAFLSNDEKQHVQVMEFTVNQPEDFIVSEIFKHQPSVLAFSCYIWNINLVLSLVEILRKIMPDVKIIAGGPEVAGDNSELLAVGVDIIVQGEGEVPFRQFVQKHMTNQYDDNPSDSDGMCFPYPTGFTHIQNRIIYYETSRGCANRCGYCLSSSTDGVRFLPWARVKPELASFLAEQVSQVKFVDRTFNCNKKHTRQIWEYLIKNDNGITNFHFEIAGELLDDEMISLLSTARRGLFQFEIGVQSTNPQTLECIRRKTDTARLLDNVQKIKQSHNIHLHLDLIVGLPFEDIGSFKQSFNDVFSVFPHKLQVGFLKLLKGSQLREDAAKYGIIYKESAPYQVLQTNCLPFADVNRLQKVEHMVETFYNATGFAKTIRYMIDNYSTPYDFFDALAIHWENAGYHLVQHKRPALYTFLYNFAAINLVDKLRLVSELLKYDMLLQESVRIFPVWIDDYYHPDNRKITRTAAVHMFEYNVHEYPTTPLICRSVELCFDYTRPTWERVALNITEENA